MDTGIVAIALEGECERILAVAAIDDSIRTWRLHRCRVELAPENLKRVRASPGTRSRPWYGRSLSSMRHRF
jgi:hypothetical protein